MAYTAVITITSPTVTANSSTFSNDTGDKYLIANRIADHIGGMCGGVRAGTMDLQVNGGSTGVKASGTVTFSSLANNDTVTVGGVTFTAKTSGATGAQFNLGASDSDAAANFAAVVNSNATTQGMVTASATGAVTTVTALPYGTIGNLVSLAISAHGSVSAATLAGGINVTANTFTYSGVL